MAKAIFLQKKFRIGIGLLIIVFLVAFYLMLWNYNSIRSFTVEESITILKKNVGISINAGTKISIQRVFGNTSISSVYDMVLEKSSKWVFKIGDKTSNIHFSKPIKILLTTPLPEGTKVRVKSKHVWESIFTESWLTKTVDATCTDWLPSVQADLSTVADNQVIIYTCSLSEFIIEPVFVLWDGNVWFDGPVNVIEQLSDGSMLVWWRFSTYKWTLTNWLVKILSDWKIDTWFSLDIWNPYYNGTQAIAQQNDGKILIWSTVLMRINANGIPDEDFNTTNLGINGYDIKSIIVLPNNQILVWWLFPWWIKLINEDGSAAGSSLWEFGAIFWYRNDSWPRVIKQQSDWKILIGWRISSYMYPHPEIVGFNVSIESNWIIRLNSDLTVDTWFTSYFAWEYIDNIVIQDDGKIIIWWDFNSYDGSAFCDIARLNPDGSLDSSFIWENERACMGDIRSLTIQSDDKVILWSMPNWIIRLDQNGDIDPSFSAISSWFIQWAMINSITIDEDQNIIIWGVFNSYKGQENVSNIIRLRPNGANDGVFSNNIAKINWGMHSMAKQNDGKPLLLGAFLSYEWNSSPWIVRLNSDLSFDTTFQSPFAGWLGLDSKIHVQDDGKILIWSYFTITANHGQINNIIRLLPNWTIDETFLPDASLNDLYNNCSNVRFAFQSDDKTLVWHCYLSRLNSDGSIDSGFDINWTQVGQWYSSRSTIWLQDDGKILLVHEWKITRLLPNGEIDPSFNRKEMPFIVLQERINRIVQLADNKILIWWRFGAVSTWNNTTSFFRLRSNGEIDNTFIGPSLLEGSTINEIIVDDEWYIYLWWTLYTNPLTPGVWSTLLKLYPNGTIYYTPPMPDSDNGLVHSLLLQNSNELLVWWYFSTYSWVNVSNNFIKVTDIDPPAVIPAPAAPTITYPTSGTVLTETWSIIIRGTWVANMDINVTLSGIQYEGTTTSTWIWEITSLQLWEGNYTINATVANSMYNKTSPATTSLFIIQTELPSTWEVTPPPAPSQWGGGWGGGWWGWWESTPSSITPPSISQGVNDILQPSAGNAVGITNGETQKTLLIEELKNDIEMQSAYQFAFDNKMTRPIWENKQSIYSPLTREELARIMSAYIKNVDKKKIPQNKECNLEKYEDYRSINRGNRVAVLEMCNLGLFWVKSDGKPIALFNPKWIVTRAEMSTILSRYLYGSKYNSEWEMRYVTHMNALKATWVIKTSTSPTKKEIRWFMFIMLHRIHTSKK
jgi:uncharacterized delta-60 repeat protein